MVRITKSLRDKKIDVLITPECYLDSYMVSPKQGDGITKEIMDANLVSGFDDPTILRIRDMALQLKSYICFGASEKENRSYRNCAYLINRKGEPAGADITKYMPANGINLVMNFLYLILIWKSRHHNMYRQAMA